MKKLILLLYVCLYAGYSPGQQISAGVKAAYTANTVVGKVFDADAYQTTHNSGYVDGFSLGIPVEFSLGKTLALQTEINFTQKGFSVEGDFIDRADVRYSYFEVPLLLKFRFYRDPMQFFFLTGPYFSRSVGKIYIEQTSTLFGDSNEKQSYRAFKAQKVDSGFQIGIGIAGETEGVHIFLDARLMIGLRNISNNGTESYKHVGGSLGMGVLAPLTGKRKRHL